MFVFVTKHKHSPSHPRVQPGKDFTNLRYGGSGSYNFTAPAVTAGLGCEAADFVNVTGKIVVIEALTSGDPCLIVEKAINAEDAGAAASLIYRFVVGRFPFSFVFISMFCRGGVPLTPLTLIGWRKKTRGGR